MRERCSPLPTAIQREAVDCRDTFQSNITSSASARARVVTRSDRGRHENAENKNSHSNEDREAAYGGSREERDSTGIRRRRRIGLEKHSAADEDVSEGRAPAWNSSRNAPTKPPYSANETCAASLGRSGEANQSQISLRKYFLEKSRVHERNEAAAGMREHQLAGCGKQRQQQALVTVFDETRRETLRHTKDQEQRELGTPTGQRRCIQPRQLTWDQGGESSRRDRRSRRRAAFEYHDGSLSSSSSPVKLPRRDREKASSTEDGKRRTEWSPVLEILQERRFKEYATGNRKHRREDVAHSGSRQDAKTAEHYNGTR